MKGDFARSKNLEDVDGVVLRSDLVLNDLRLEVDCVDNGLPASFLYHENQ